MSRRDWLALCLAVVWAAVFFLWAALAYSAERRVDTAIVFVVDCSNSMDYQERALVREAHIAAITSPDVQQAIRELPSHAVAMAYVEFSAGRAETRIGWTLVTGLISAEAFVAPLRAADDCSIVRGNTPIDVALGQALTLLGTLPYTADRLVVDVVGDGQDNNGLENDDDVSADLPIMRAALLAIGATINGLPMVLSTTEAETLVPWYCGTATQAPNVRGGYGSFCRTLNDIADLPIELRQKIVQELY